LTVRAGSMAEAPTSAAMATAGLMACIGVVLNMFCALSLKMIIGMS